MQSNDVPFMLRRSSRVPATMPILVTSLDGTHFSEVCETLVVNAHGCAIKSRVRLDAGVPLHFHSREGRETTAQVVSCEPLGPDKQSWRLGARLDRPENFWGLQHYPKDWAFSLGSALLDLPQKATAEPHNSRSLPAVSAAAAPAPAPVVKAEAVRQMITEAVSLFQAELAAVKEKLAHNEANRSRFDVSLSSIPPELEEKLEQRLRQDLSPKVIEEARQQATQLLSKTEAAISQKAAAAQQEFQRRSAEELEFVEQRAHDIASQITNHVREKLSDGIGDFDRRLADGRTQLQRLSEELLHALQSSLNEEHRQRLEHLEQLRTAVSAESSRLQQQVEQLDGRIRRLDEAVRSLEAGLDQRLNEMAADAVKRTRTEIEGIADAAFKEVTARSARVLEQQMDEASGNMRIVQRGILSSASDSLKVHSAEALQQLAKSMDELGQASIEGWKVKMANGFNSLVSSLGEHFRSGNESETTQG